MPYLKPYSVAPCSKAKYYRSRWFDSLEAAIGYAKAKTATTGKEHVVRSVYVAAILWPQNTLTPK
jgi:hypothetical protein